MDIDVWTTHSLEKLFPDSLKPRRASRCLRLQAARSETEDAQIAVRIPRGVEIAAACFRFSELSGPGGNAIKRTCLSAHWVWYTHVLANPRGNNDPSTYLRQAPAFFPDAFLEESVIRIRDEWTQPLWVSVRIPKRTKPGTYNGSIEIDLTTKDSDRCRHTVPIELTVWPFALPDKPSLHHTEWFWPDDVANYYHLERWSSAHWTWIRKAAEDMAAHRQDMILTPFFSLVDVTRLASGKLKLGFKRLDKWIRTFRKAGVVWIEGGHVARREAGWNSRIRWTRFPMKDADGETIDTSRETLTDGEFEPYMQAFLQGIHTHLKKRGWHRKYVQHISDEPIDSNCESWIALRDKVKSWLPGVKNIDATCCEQVIGKVDWRVPQVQEIDKDYIPVRGETMWSYVCLAPRGLHPNRFLDYASIRNRILFWLSFSLDLKGFLHWGYNSWKPWTQVPMPLPPSPWYDATGGSVYVLDRSCLPAGDPFIVYPGKKKICSSLRWEVIRKGMEDFEYLVMLQKAVDQGKGPKEVLRKAKDLLRKVRTKLAVDSLHYTRDDKVLLRTRRQIGELLAKLS